MIARAAEPTGAATRTHSSNRAAPSHEYWEDYSADAQDPDVTELDEQLKPTRRRLGLLGLVIFLFAVATVMIGFQSGFFGGLLQSPRDAQSLVPAVPQAAALTATSRD
jgi:hypothetical protein